MLLSTGWKPMRGRFGLRASGGRNHPLPNAEATSQVGSVLPPAARQAELTVARFGLPCLRREKPPFLSSLRSFCSSPPAIEPFEGEILCSLEDVGYRLSWLFVS